ncbi:Ester cyclase OS=Streptomyces microflavus OX=1919 GN=G3I39_37215 PE=4 SV=1 [Streptomyces microflavus]
MPTTLTPEQQREVVEKVFHEGLDLGDLTAADRYLTSDFRNHGSHDDSMRGPEAFKHTIQSSSPRSARSSTRSSTSSRRATGPRSAG